MEHRQALGQHLAQHDQVPEQHGGQQPIGPGQQLRGQPLGPIAGGQPPALLPVQIEQRRFAGRKKRRAENQHPHDRQPGGMFHQPVQGRLLQSNL